MARVSKFDPHEVIICTNTQTIEISCTPPNNFDEEIIEKIWEDIDE